MTPEKSDHDMIIEIYNTLCGINGEGGCLKRHNKVADDFYSFRRWAMITLAFVAGGGGVTFGVFELLKRTI